MRIAIFGGSFNPPHNGHVKAAVAAKKALKADRLIVIPTGVSPHKLQPEGSPTAEERLRLTRLAFEGHEGVEVSDIETRRHGRSYTVDTLEELRCENPDAELYLLLGADMLLSFDSIWWQYLRILELAKLCVFARNNSSMDELETKCRRLHREYGADIKLLYSAPEPMSSTEIRALLPARGGTEMLSSAVYSEIIRRRFYGAQPNLDWLKEQMKLYVDEKRVPHVLGCAGEAVRLARRWGEDEDLAAEAGLLHDITKKQNREEQLQLCDKYGIITDNNERENYKLLHSKTGAAFSREHFGINDRVYRAISRHTTGCPDMSVFDKIIYLADYIEPHRSFKGLDKLRSLAYTDLDGALMLGLEMSIEDLEERGIEPHSNSVNALKQLKALRDGVN